jgi:hypothetical protein
LGIELYRWFSPLLENFLTPQTGERLYATDMRFDMFGLAISNASAPCWGIALSALVLLDTLLQQPTREYQQEFHPKHNTHGKQLLLLE